MRPSSNTGANSLCRVRRETSRMDPPRLGEPTKGERHKTPSPVRRYRINRADPERDRRPRDPRSKPDNQESAQRSVQEEEPTASSASPSGTQIIRPRVQSRNAVRCRQSRTEARLRPKEPLRTRSGPLRIPGARISIPMHLPTPLTARPFARSAPKNTSRHTEPSA